MKPKTDTELLFECVDVVRNFFEELGTPRKAIHWFETPNPMLGEIRPIAMIKHDRIKKLNQVIVNMVNGYGP